MESTTSEDVTGTEQRGVFALFRALVDSGVDLAHNTAQMAASECRIVLWRVAVRLGLFFAALSVAVIGLLLALVGAALFLSSTAGMEPWAAFATVGFVTLIAGAGFAVRAMRRLDDPDLAFPATLAELGADIEMFRGGRDAAKDDGP